MFLPASTASCTARTSSSLQSHVVLSNSSFGTLKCWCLEELGVPPLRLLFLMALNADAAAMDVTATAAAATVKRMVCCSREIIG